MKHQITLSGIFLFVAAIFGGIFSYLFKGRGSLKVKSLVIYSAIFLILMAALGLVGLTEMETPFSTYICLQLMVLLLGVLHTWLLYKINRWPSRGSFWPELVFTLVVTFVGLTGFIWVFGWLNGKDYLNLFSTAALLFPLPYLVLKSFDYALGVPFPEYKKWFYSSTDIPQLEEFPDERVIVIALEFCRNPGDKVPVKSRAKAPLRMEFGSYYALFLNEYNEAHIGTPIQYLDDIKQDFGWTFYKKNKWWQLKKYIDPSDTFEQNKLRENDIIVAERHQIIND